MNLKNSKLRIRIEIFLFAIVLCIVTVRPSYATDSVDDLDQTTSDLESELSGLNSELDVLSAELDAIVSQIADTSAQLTAAKEALSIAKGEEEAQYESMKLRIKYMYENGNTSILEMLFSSTCMAEFLNRAEFYSAITEYDRALLEQLTKTRENITRQEMELEEKQTQLASLQSELSEKEATIYSQISSASAELSHYSALLAKAREEAARAEEALKQEVIPVPPAKPQTPVQDVPVEEAPTENSPEYNAPTEELPNATASDVELLAALIECEAGSSDYEGMLAVGSVVVNRMNHRYYPDTLHGVIFQSGQFPPAANGKVDRILERGVKDSCVTAAQDALNGKNNVGDCLSFRASSSGHSGTVIGDNVFF